MGLNTSNGEDDDSFFIVDANGNKAMQVDENGVTSFDFITDNGSSLEALASKLSNITDSADAVSYSQTQTSGTKIGAITINGSTTNIYVPNLSGGEGEKADISVVSGVTVDKHAVTVAKKNISGDKGITTSGTADTITISHNTTGGTDVTATAGKAVTSLTIDNYGHVTATGTGNIINSITISGTGNAITGGSVTNGAATLTKGATFKTQQTAVSSPAASSTAVAFIDTIS